jgi:hypothetical protein
MILFCDIDGTLVDNSHRKNLVVGVEKKNWDAFYSDELTRLDTPFPEAQKKLIQLTSQVTDYFFLTGRPEKCRSVTLWQLATHFKCYPHPQRLLMRQDHDWRPSPVYKEGHIRENLSSVESGLFVDDDLRNEVVYIKYGVFLKAPECWGIIR